MVPGLVRDFTKWDDTPLSLAHFAESATRAYQFSMTPPWGPTVLAVDQELQENDIPAGTPPGIPKLSQLAPPAGEEGAIRETARLLVAAERPLIIADRAARTPEGLRLMIELAEALQAAVVDVSGRMNFPWRHPLNQTRRQATLVAEADLILGLELTDYWGAIGGRLAPGTKRISISSTSLYMKSNYQDFERYTPVDLAIAADAEATLPQLVEEVKKQTPARRRAFFKGARSQAGTGSPGIAATVTGCRGRRLGLATDHDRTTVRGALRADPRTRTGRCATARSSRTTGHNNCGPPVNTINTSATPEPMGWVICRALRSAPRSRTRSTGAWLWRSEATGICCSLRRRSGRQRTTRYRCSMSYITTVPTTRKSCSCNRWR